MFIFLINVIRKKIFLKRVVAFLYVTELNKQTTVEFRPICQLSLAFFWIAALSNRWAVSGG